MVSKVPECVGGVSPWDAVARPPLNWIAQFPNKARNVLVISELYDANKLFPNLGSSTHR